MFALKNNMGGHLIATRHATSLQNHPSKNDAARFNRDVARHVATKTLPALNSAVRFNRDAARHVATKKNPRKPV